MNLSLSHCYVTVHDPDEALRFYRDTLGLEVRSDVADGGFRWVALSPPSHPDIQIVLNPTHPGREADGDTVLALLAKGSLNGVVFNTDDVDATFEQIRASGAEVLQEPIDQAWGVRDCSFRDPSGNEVRFNQKRTA
jgi:catechol 2,3-dioxygenase-like lactoylglutathione lyase family enzyme